MRGQHFRQTTIGLRRFVNIAAAQYDAFVAHPFHHLVVPNESILANSFAIDLDKPPFRRCARHDPTRAVHRREKRFARNRRVDSFDNDRVVAHASANKSFLAGKRRRRAFAHDPELFAIVFLLPGEVVMVVHFLENLRAQDSPNDMPRDRFPPRVGIAPGQMHARDVITADLRILWNNCRRNIHSVLAAGCFQEMRRRLVAEPARTEMHADPDAILLICKNIDVMISAADRAELLRGALTLNFAGASAFHASSSNSS